MKNTAFHYFLWQIFVLENIRTVLDTLRGTLQNGIRFVKIRQLLRPWEHFWDFQNHLKASFYEKPYFFTIFYAKAVKIKIFRWTKRHFKPEFITNKIDTF